MGIQGRTPGDDPLHRNKPVYEQVELVPDGKLRGPTLPRGYDWCDRTKEWWKAWRKSAQAQLMDEVDWEFMMETAFLHDAYWNPTSLVALVRATEQ